VNYTTLCQPFVTLGICGWICSVIDNLSAAQLCPRDDEARECNATRNAAKPYERSDDFHDCHLGFPSVTTIEDGPLERARRGTHLRGFGLRLFLSFGDVTTTSGSWVCAAAALAKPSAAAMAEPRSARRRKVRKVSTDIKSHS